MRSPRWRATKRIDPARLIGDPEAGLLLPWFRFRPGDRRTTLRGSAADHDHGHGKQEKSQYNRAATANEVTELIFHRKRLYYPEE